MSISVAKLRVWLLVGAGLLVGVIAAFVGVAHYKTHRFLKDLPAKLGVDIQQETTGFTYSQSNGAKGRTIYTIHAAKAQQRKDGKLALHDVGIVLYGNGQGSEQRADRIYGNEFEYDQNSGVVRAIGVVHIDLQAPAPQDPKAKSEYAKGEDIHRGEETDQHLIHVTTSDLVFLQRLGTAATSADLEFQYNGMTGHAHGADYSTDTGDLVLEQTVKVEGMQDGRPAVLTADRAELKRDVNQLLLSRARYTVSQGKDGTRVVKADHVTAFLRGGGSVDRAMGAGGVSLADTDGTMVTAQRGEVRLNAANKPQMATLSGEVLYGLDEPLRQIKGEAGESHADFDQDGLLKHAVLTGAVHLHERVRGTGGPGAVWDERDLTAKTVDLEMVTERGRRSELQRAQAEGKARVMVVSNVPARLAGANKSAGGKRTSVLQGDLLTAVFRPYVTAGVTGSNGGAVGVGSELKTINGEGHTVLHRILEDGGEATTSGDRLEVMFRETSGAGAQRSSGLEEIATADQLGHVAMTNRPAPKQGNTAGTTEQHATAERALYDGDKDEVTLTGTVELSDIDSMVWGDKVVMDRKTGDGTAEGGVRATYLQAKEPGSKATGSGAEPVHVLAVRGEFKHDSRRALFYGMGGLARLWQGTSQVEAPVIEMERNERLLLARGDGRPGTAVVHAVFLSGGTAGVSDGAAKTPGKQSTIRVSSRDLTYNDAVRRADFSGGVLVENGEETLRAQQAALFLKTTDADSKPAGKASANTSGGLVMSGNVDRILASGNLEIVRPGRKVTGEQLVYTASDGMTVITGRPGYPPRMTDVAQGVITGASLRFHSGDNNVVVSNGPDGGSGQRVRTETRVK
jgi:lipopolysaccharide export system protein LptA